MDSDGKEKPPFFAPRVGEDEIGRILNLKEIQDQKSLMVAFAARYRKLGWDLLAIDAQQATEISVDFSQPQEIWSQYLNSLGARGIQVGLAVRTGAPSNLMVLEVTSGDGVQVLDQLGEWRAECIAQGGDTLERHYFALPSGCRLPTASMVNESLIVVHGDNNWVLVPPSSELQIDRPWRWLTPPWVRPPRHPRPALWQFLKKHVSGAVGTVERLEPELPSWEEIYRLVSPCATVLQALLAPADSPEEYYENLLKAALGVGVTDSSLLLGLLWHAPHGDALHRPERWEYLQDLVAAGLQDRPSAEVPSQPLAEPLMILGERVVVERCRYEGLLLELRRLSTRTGELERQLTEWGQGFMPDRLPSDDKVAACLEKIDGAPLGFLTEWTDLERQVANLVENFLPDTTLPEDQKESLLENYASHQVGNLQGLSNSMKQKTRQDQQADEVEAAVQECLEENPDLAGDERKVEMIHYCLKNYVNIHPDFVGLPIRERVDEASRMAREFLGEPVKSRTH